MLKRSALRVRWDLLSQTMQESAKSEGEVKGASA
jgi:hypothetical protein